MPVSLARRSEDGRADKRLLWLWVNNLKCKSLFVSKVLAIVWIWANTRLLSTVTLLTKGQAKEERVIPNTVFREQSNSKKALKIRLRRTQSVGDVTTVSLQPLLDSKRSRFTITPRYISVRTRSTYFVQMIPSEDCTSSNCFNRLSDRFSFWRLIRPQGMMDGREVR